MSSSKKHTTFPKELKIGSEILTIEEEGTSLNGLNQKKFYRDKHGNRYIAKVDKIRDSKKDIFPGSIPTFPEEDNDLKTYQTHTNDLRDSAAAANLIMADVARSIFPSLLCVPENYLCTLDDGTPVILSKILPKEVQFKEVLSEKEAIKDKYTSPEAVKEVLFVKNLAITEDEARILGIIYCVALILGHWDV